MDLSFNNVGWLILLALLFPLLVVVTGEIAGRLQRKGHGYASSVQLIRNVVLPLAVVYLLLTQLGGVSSDSLVGKLFATFSVIIGLVAVMGVINGVLFEQDRGSRFPKLFLDLGRILVIALGVAVTVSQVWGYDLNNLITALGVSSIVLGLALQDTLGNLFSGITLINERPFQVGDYVEIDGHEGMVVEVNWRAVRLLTRERDLIVLPHLTVSQTAILNHSRPELHWAEKIELGFGYDHPPNEVKRVIMEVMRSTPGILKTPLPEVKTWNFADSAIVFEVEYYIRSFGEREEIKDDFMSRVWYAARRNGIGIPFPQVNLHREPQREKARDEEKTLERHLDYAIKLLDITDEAQRVRNPRNVQLLSYGEGETLLDRGHSDHGLFLLVNGEVIIQGQDPEGQTKSLAELHRGDLVTEIIPVGQRKNAVTVLATEDTEVLYFSEKTLRRLVNRYPKLAGTIEEMLVSRRRQLGKIQGDRAGKPAR